MTKVHPNFTVPRSRELATTYPAAAASVSAPETALTVWRKSLLFNSSGFTVFDSKGDLVFRVDNYASSSSGEVVLMNAAGKPLLTVRRKKLILGETWLIYEGEQRSSPQFSARRQSNFLHGGKLLAHLSPCGSAAGPHLDVEGSYSQRSCHVYDDGRNLAAEIRRKEVAGGVALGADVFRLVVLPGLDAAVAMSVVILLDQMFGSRGALSLITG